MWTYMTNHYEGRANEVIKAHRKRQLYNKLQTAKCRENSDLVTHINYMFELREELEGLGAKVEDTLMIDFLLDSLPTHERFERIKGMIDMGFEAVNMAEKVRDIILTVHSKINMAEGANRNQEQDSKRHRQDNARPDRCLHCK
ncbi:hypothetical protein Ae201684P_019920 [Aphanomyces euteiches]|uniref:Uncharacterized protein n=1 Tax=Aphanomyces euteiches TaxID=100861 RepID=A0A6G0W3V4_9STRA|nr:hypothetical protein Ae201684_018991 [Aphanomyces euteiches]KAH9078852.1 hypothetical protein Ae201684P_019920 [Aphanomyces euteiches]